MDDTQHFTHTFVDKKSSNLFLLLHGTGGDEHDLIPLAEEIDPTYSILSLRGNMNENGMNRFFERYEDGSFNVKNIKDEVKKLHMFLEVWLKEHNKRCDDLVMLGYSNGANFGLSFLFLYPNIIKKAILLHPTLPFKPASDLSLKNTKILVTNGKYDTYSTPEKVSELKEMFVNMQADATFYQHNGGHELQESEITEAKEFLLTM